MNNNMFKKMTQKSLPSIMAITVTMFGLVFPGVASAAFVHDGILTTPGEYANSFETEWYNDHWTLAFPVAGGQATTVRWEKTPSEFRLYVQAPLSAKNMVWGNYFDLSVNVAEALQYYQAWCSPNDGNLAALNGSNCAHHKDGFDAANAAGDPNETFLEKILSDDFKTMVDSELVEINGEKFKLIATKDPATINDALVYSSLTYIFDKNGTGERFEGCDEDGCGAWTTPMSFEMVFSDPSKGEALKDWLENPDNDLIFHLSPERGGAAIPVPPAAIPVPAAVWLFGSGLLGLVGIARRKKA
jgi:hypothetical protein